MQKWNWPHLRGWTGITIDVYWNHHSDKGSQYVSLAYTERLKEAKLLASTGRTGDSYGSAMAESINDLYKAEYTIRAGKIVQKWNWPHLRGWTGITIRDGGEHQWSLQSGGNTP